MERNAASGLDCKFENKLILKLPYGNGFLFYDDCAICGAFVQFDV